MYVMYCLLLIPSMAVTMMGNLYKHPTIMYHLTNIIVFVTDIGITPILLPL